MVHRRVEIRNQKFSRLTVKLIRITLIILFAGNICFASEISSGQTYITPVKSNEVFNLVYNGKSSPLVCDSNDYAGVLKTAGLIQTDIGKVTGVIPELIMNNLSGSKEVVIIGTIGKNRLIDKLIRTNKLDVQGIQNHWETFVIQTIQNPFPDVDKALVIAGSDKRGTIFGMFDLSENIGVSPWYFWADVPVKKQSQLFVKPVRFTMGEPKVKYRGIFINDEAPALSGWVFEKFGGFNSKFYENVFELILRLKGNFLWPAMWGRAFYDDDPLNPELADEYGVVIGTSHHEPMMRAHDEWRRYGDGPWNYEKNESVLRDFWSKGIERMGQNESIITLAMRGDGDEAMSPDANVSLLQKIVNDQRKIINEVTGKEITSVPQVWALYKEVQEYYNKGMRVPDDVTLLLCDDNWGNVRKLPNLSDEPRKGGYGMYYHYDFVGGPRNYKWLNTNQIERVWQQMGMAYDYGVKEIWIVNVGDIKPMEFPINFFLDYAWDPEKIKAEDLSDYYVNWACEQFGESYKIDIAEIISKYTKFNSRRKPELLDPGTYSLINFKEAEQIVSEYRELENKAEKIYNQIDEVFKDAFYQLVLHPVQACANLNDMLVTIGRNRLYAKQGRVLTNTLAEQARKLFDKDAEITSYYNQVLAGGKWNHMMDQTHIGYTYWQQPDNNVMPEVNEIALPEQAEMGVSIEGSEKWWPEEKSEATLPEFNQFDNPSYYLEIFNRGKNSFNYSISPADPCIKLSSEAGIINSEERIWVSIDWSKAPEGKNIIPVNVKCSTGINVTVNAVVNNITIPAEIVENCFLESNGYISMNAENYSNSVNTAEHSWLKIPNLGKTASAMTISPVNVEKENLSGEDARLEYNLYLFSKGEVTVKFFFSPTLNYGYSDGLKFAASFDDDVPVVININKDDDVPDWKYPQYWNQQVSENIRIISEKFYLDNPGKHVLKFRAINTGVVLQKIVVETMTSKSSYLGPPESYIGRLSISGMN